MKILNKKNIIIAVILGIIPVILFTSSIIPNLIKTLNATNNDYHISIEPLKNTMNKEAYLDWLKHEEETIWQDITALTSISLDRCKTTYKDLQNKYDEQMAEQKKKLSINEEIASDIKKVFEEVITDLGVPSFELISYNEPAVGMALGSTIFINENLFNTMSRFAQKFVIAHEIMHVLSQDAEIRFVLYSIGFSANDESVKNAINKLLRFQEIRADMVAALTNAEYAQGYNEYVHNALARRNNEEMNELYYPTFALRMAISEKIQKFLVV